ncbi:MAG: PHP domain-containing protein [Acidobacteriota bacterium]
MGDSKGCQAARAELHTHTTYSDGSLTPRRLVEGAEIAGLEALAVTDHDTVAGVAEAKSVAQGLRLELIAGLEFSANIEDKEVHLLGLFVDVTCGTLLAATERARAYRRDRAQQIVVKLNDLGLDLDFSIVEDEAGAGSIGRPHIAAALVRRGFVNSVNSAFHRYLGIGCAAFVPKPTLHAQEVIGIVHAAGGVTVLAHPGSSRVSDESIGALAAWGLDGFEVRHPKHKMEQEAHLRKLIKQTGLLPSGGSDYHGPGSGRTALGSYAVPLVWLEALRSRAARHARNSTSKESRS